MNAIKIIKEYYKNPELLENEIEALLETYISVQLKDDKILSDLNIVVICIDRINSEFSQNKKISYLTSLFQSIILNKMINSMNEGENNTEKNKKNNCQKNEQNISIIENLFNSNFKQEPIEMEEVRQP